MTHRAETFGLKPGQCRVCGCTERKPCAINFVDQDGEAAAVACIWIDTARTLCSNPTCVASSFRHFHTLAILRNNGKLLPKCRRRRDPKFGARTN